MNRKLIAAIMPMMVMAAAAAVAQEAASPMAKPPLGVGSPAPALKVDKWLKGTPVKDIKKGTHVVEFWATWCGPCLESIPHITELAKKHKGKVSFTGVSVWEDVETEGWQATVSDFVKDMGAKMDYNVAVDNAEGTMATTWMEAAGQNGIPAAFIVDKGTILWIGHPMDLDAVLEKVVKGEFDAAEAKRMAEEKQAQEAKLMAAAEKLNTAMETGDTDTAVKAIDEMVAAQPLLAPQLIPLKFQILSTSAPDEAIEVARKALEKDFKDNANVLNDLAWALIDPEGELMKRDNALALKMATRAVELTKENDAFMLDTLALALWLNDKKADAVTKQEKAVKLAKNPPEGSPEVPAEILAEMEARLEKFRKG